MCIERSGRMSGGLPCRCTCADGQDHIGDGQESAALIVKVQSHGMTDKVLGTCFESELLVDDLHSVLVKVDALGRQSVLVTSWVTFTTYCTHPGA